jgi:hypothetical protein
MLALGYPVRTLFPSQLATSRYDHIEIGLVVNLKTFTES